MTLMDALQGVQVTPSGHSINDFIDRVGMYAEILINGEASKPLRKGFKQAEKASKNVEKLLNGISPGDSPIQDNIAKIKISSDAAAQGLEQNLIEIYFSREQIEKSTGLVSPELALAHADAIDDLIKYNQGLIRAVDDLRNQHILATQDYLAAMLDLEVVRNKVNASESIRDIYNRVLQNFNNNITKSQVDIDKTIRNTLVVQDRLMLMRYFYIKSQDFLYLKRPATDIDLTIFPLLIIEDARYLQLENSSNVMNQFINFIKTHDDGYVFDTIAPVQYKVQYTDTLGDTTPTISSRSRTEINQALCPNNEGNGQGAVCKITKPAYDNLTISQLQKTGFASFEIYPDSLESFKSLSDEEKLNWNRSFSLAEFHYTQGGYENIPSFRKRVIDVSLRFSASELSVPIPNSIAEN